GQRQVGLRQRFRSQRQIAGEWTIHGLAQELGVRRTWLYTRIRNGTLPARRHPVSGQYLLPTHPHLLAILQTDRDAHPSASEGIVLESSRRCRDAPPTSTMPRASPTLWPK